MTRPAVQAPQRDRRFLLASAALHGLALAGLAWAATRPLPPAEREQGLALVWENLQEGAGDAAEGAARPGPATPPAPPAPPAIPQPEASAPPAPPPPAVAPPAPEVPPLIATAPPPPAPVVAPPPAPERAPPEAPPVVAAAPPPPPAEAPPTALAALPAPPPPPPTPPPAEPALPAPPRPRPAPQAPAAQPATPAEPPVTIWRPPGRPGGAEDAAPFAAGGLAIGPVVPARPLPGAANPRPTYPAGSRLRGEEGSVRLLVQVDAAGSVTGTSVLTSSGFPDLDRAAEDTVRRWRFEPATQDGRPVIASATVGITFRLEGDRRW